MEAQRRQPGTTRSAIPLQTKSRLAAEAAARAVHHPRSRVRERIDAFGRHYGYSPPEALYQREAMRAVGCASIGDDLGAVIEKLRTGDVLVVARLRMLAHSIGELREVVRKVTSKGATIISTEQPFDADGGFLALLDIFAEFEPTAVRPEQSKASKGGRPRLIDDAKVLAFKEQGHSVAAVAQHFGVSKSAVYACLAKAK